MSIDIEEQQQPQPEQPAEEAPEALDAAALAEEQLPLRFLRPSVAAGLMATATAFLVGGMFTGIMPRVWGTLGGVVGVLMAGWGARTHKRQNLVQAVSIFGIFLPGLIVISIADAGALGRLPDEIGRAIKEARAHKPPIAFDTGWHAVVPWTVAAIGYASAWIGIVMRKPAVAILLPMPVIAFSAIAQPPEAQVIGGIVVLLCFIISLAVIFRPDYGEDEAERVPISFEIKRAMRTAPLVILLAAGMAVLGQTDLLFPPPIYDPAQKAVLPRAKPLKDVEDKILFTVRSTITGPWRTGVLDVYDGRAWRIPPFAASDFIKVPNSGVLDPDREADSAAAFKLDGLEGTVLPIPARAQLISGNLPALVTDERTGTVRVQTGQVRGGLEYDAVFEFTPREKLLRNAPPPPAEMAEYLDTNGVEAPATVRSLLERAPQDNLWDRFDFVRKRFLDTVVLAGGGTPVEVPAERVEEMLGSTNNEATPFEVAAAQGLLARWSGIPARIGYGFDGGTPQGTNFLEVHPLHGSLWLEVWFEPTGWVPVTGLPKNARSSIDPDAVTQESQNVIPTDDIAVNLWVPMRIPPSNVLLRRVQLLVLMAIPVVLAGLLVYASWPAYVKWRRRSRRRHWALRHGPRARIAVAYADFRDMATDLGLGDPFATPLAFLEEVVPDEEHEELAWLVTRVLWGDLSAEADAEDVFAAEELVRSLRRRMFEAQPITIRFISFISRLSLRQPFAPELISIIREAPAIEAPKEVVHA